MLRGSYFVFLYFVCFPLFPWYFCYVLSGILMLFGQAIHHACDQFRQNVGSSLATCTSALKAPPSIPGGGSVLYACVKLVVARNQSQGCDGHTSMPHLGLGGRGRASRRHFGEQAPAHDPCCNGDPRGDLQLETRAGREVSVQVKGRRTQLPRAEERKKEQKRRTGEKGQLSCMRQVRTH